jgi:predicted AAA+ superfamily ATPase
MDVLRLFPFSEGEIDGKADGFIDTVFSMAPLPDNAIRSDFDLGNRIVRGGFPEIVTTIAPHRRSNWWDSYILAIVQRDLRELSNVVDLDHIPRLLSLLATRTATLLNHAELSRSTGIPTTTLRRYMAMLKSTFLVSETLPWHANLGKRLVKTPKIHLMDTGLVAHLQGLNDESLREQRDRIGPLLETFVTQELEKQLTWSHVKPGLYHFRTHGGQEVDLVLEDRSGRIVGVEIKASSTVTGDMFENLRAFAALTRKKFVRGIVLYNGTEVIPFGRDLHAVPVAALWTWGGRKLEKEVAARFL